MNNKLFINKQYSRCLTGVIKQIMDPAKTVTTLYEFFFLTGVTLLFLINALKNHRKKNKFDLKQKGWSCAHTLERLRFNKKIFITHILCGNKRFNLKYIYARINHLKW